MAEVKGRRGGDRYLEEGDVDSARWRELGPRVTRLVLFFNIFFSFPSGGGGGKVKRDLAGPSTTNGGFDLPAEPPCCYMRLKRQSGNAFFSVLFRASALAAAHASFMPQRSNRAIKEKNKLGQKKRRGRRKRWIEKAGKKHLCLKPILRYFLINSFTKRNN